MSTGSGRPATTRLLATPDPDDGEKDDSLPAGWRRLLARCTGRKIENRLPDFTAVLAELEQVTKQAGTEKAEEKKLGGVSEFESDMKEALEEMQTKGDTKGLLRGDRGQFVLASGNRQQKKGIWLRSGFCPVACN